jgi:DNA polymerase-3 subunit alpha/error-prone DNA polymerase
MKPLKVRPKVLGCPPDHKRRREIEPARGKLPAPGNKSPAIGSTAAATGDHELTQSRTRIPYVELLARSNFSFLQAVSHPEEVAAYAQELGYRGLALCDLNGLYGVVRGFQAIEYPSNFLAPTAAQDNGFKFYAGAEMQLADRSSIALIPIHKDGYTNLCQIITRSKRESEKRFSNLNLEILEEFESDLLAFALPPWNVEKLERLRGIYGDRLYLPVWKDYTWESLQLYQHAQILERDFGYELFATQRPFMARAEMKPLHDVVTCINHGTTLREAKTRLLSNRERHLKPLDELAKLWSDRLDLVTKTCDIAARIQFSLKELQYEYPEASRPPGVEASDYLRQLTEDGLKRRYPKGITPKIREMVEHELSLIGELRYEDYFLTLWDVCQFAVKQGILHQGRGSAANSIVCYSLGLTAVDPTQVQLLFERFISKERGEPPDIDIDFESGRREEVLQYIYKKYGATHAAMVCTVICYRGRLALRECAKVFEIPLQTINQMIKHMGRDGVKRLEEEPELARQWGLEPGTYELFLKLAQALVSTPRHLGIHTGGFLIAKRPITECVPVEKATMDQRYVIQWNKDDLTVLKMLKIDILGLGMLSALEKCFRMLKTHRGVELDLYSTPHGDEPTYKMIQQADTVGTFQVESRAQMSLLPRLKPKCFYDLVIEVAIVRPGPIQGGMIHPFIRRRDGLEPVVYPHPDLKPILEKTCGVPIFQEQIMQMASAVCGFTPGEADELRRIMSSSWKKHELMEGLRQRLIAGMLKHGIVQEYAEQIYQTIIGFASYGFPESHAASFAIIAYVSCYLKCHYPDLFVASLLNAQPMGFYSPRALIMDAQRHGVEFLAVDVQKSQYDYTIEDAGVRVGFRAIYGLKEKHIERLIQERARGGPFKDLTDLVRRTSLHKSTLLKLASTGAFAPFGLGAREALWKTQSVNVSAQSLFFGLSGSQDSEHVPREGDWDRLEREYRTQGYSLVHHPLSVLRPALNVWSEWEKKRQRLTFTRSDRLAALKNGTRVRVAGLLSLQQRPPTAKGFAFLTLEDEAGIFNIVIKPDAYEGFRHTIIHYPMLHVQGVLEKVEGVLNIIAKIIKPLPVEKMLKATEPQFDFSSCFDDHTVG